MPCWEVCSNRPCLTREDGPDGVRGPFQPQLLSEPVEQITSYYLGNNHRESGVSLMKTLVLVVWTCWVESTRECISWVS